MTAPVKHRMDWVPGAFKPSGFALCGVRKDEKTPFATTAARVTCPGCRRIMLMRQSVARSRNAAGAGVSS